VSAPSLLEIQLEQARQLAEEQSQQELQAKVSHHQLAVEATFISSVQWFKSREL